MRDQAPEAPEAPEAPPAPPFDVSVLGDAVLAHEGEVVRVDRSAWKQVAELCRDRLHMDYFCFLSGIDWMPAPGLSGEKVFDPDAPTEGGDEAADAGSDAEMATGVAGGETRFQVLARLYSTRDKVGITLKADLDDADPAVESWTEVYRGADWHERETWEMYGFRFDGHPSLRHIYLPGEFEGHPLRKDFPLLAREVKPWPGLVDVEPMPGEPEGDGEAEGGETA
ncbi:MAG: NADH-quinone oxidoreductase subunit C [Actinomycetota bacterium]|nr:NADH-quinone oxidoreductase subunit C [Actinomycetota bacterium]